MTTPAYGQGHPGSTAPPVSFDSQHRQGGKVGTDLPGIVKIVNGIPIINANRQGEVSRNYD